MISFVVIVGHRLLSSLLFLLLLINEHRRKRPAFCAAALVRRRLLVKSVARVTGLVVVSAYIQISGRATTSICYKRACLFTLCRKAFTRADASQWRRSVGVAITAKRAAGREGPFYHSCSDTDNDNLHSNSSVEGASQPESRQQLSTLGQYHRLLAVAATVNVNVPLRQTKLFAQQI